MKTEQFYLKFGISSGEWSILAQGNRIQRWAFKRATKLGRFYVVQGDHQPEVEVIYCGYEKLILKLFRSWKGRI